MLKKKEIEVKAGQTLTYIPPPQLTKREYFAVMALPGVLQRNGEPISVAKSCVKYADHLIAELEKEPLKE